MKKIAAMGTHGACKSTLCADLNSYFKHDGKNSIIIEEQVRLSPFPYNDKMIEETALWAFHAQVAAELEAAARGYDVLICDRTAIDCFFYADYWKVSTQRIEYLRHAAFHWLKSYDLFFFIEPDLPLEVDSRRSPDVNFQNGIHEIFRTFIHNLSLEEEMEIIFLKSSQVKNKTINFNLLLT